MGSIGHPSTAQFLLIFTIGAVLGGAVWIHADRNGIRHQTAWAMFVVFFPALALALYVLHVRRKRRNAT